MNNQETQNEDKQRKKKPASLNNKHINNTDPTKKPEVNSCAREGLEVPVSPKRPLSSI